MDVGFARGWTREGCSYVTQPHIRCPEKMCSRSRYPVDNRLIGCEALMLASRLRQKECAGPRQARRNAFRWRAVRRGAHTEGVLLLFKTPAVPLVTRCTYTRLFTVAITGEPERRDLCLAPVAR